MSDNFFLYNRQFPSYKPLKSVTVGSGRVGSGRVGPVHSIYRLIGSKQTLFVPSTICSKYLVSEIQLFSRYPLVRYSLLRLLADAHFASLAITVNFCNRDSGVKNLSKSMWVQEFKFNNFIHVIYAFFLLTVSKRHIITSQIFPFVLEPKEIPVGSKTNSEFKYNHILYNFRRNRNSLFCKY